MVGRRNPCACVAIFLHLPLQLGSTDVIVKYVPAWFPGASFRRLGAKWKREYEEASAVPYERAKRDIVSLIHPVPLLLVTEHYLPRLPAETTDIHLT